MEGLTVQRVQEFVQFAGVASDLIITGSTAIWLLAQNNDQVCSFVPNDFDFVEVGTGLDAKRRCIGNFTIREGQSVITRVVTYESSDGHQTFDYVTVPSARWIEVFGLRVMHPADLLDQYETNKRDKDVGKIALLQHMVTLYAAAESHIERVAKRKTHVLNQSDVDDVDDGLAKRLF